MLQSWFFLAVLTAVVYGAQAVYLKAFTSEIDRVLVAWSVFAFGIPVYVTLLVAQGIPVVEPRFWWAVSVSLAVNVVAWPMFVRALQISDVSLVMPLVALTPAFVLVVEWAILGGVPSRWGLVGILVIVFGAYILNVQPKGDRASGFVNALLEPLRALVSDKGAVMMLAVAAMWSVSATVEKVTVTSSSPAFYLTVLSCGFALIFSPVLIRRLERPVREIRLSFFALAGAGLLTALMLVVQMQALETTPLANYVIAIKRAGMLVAVVLGWLVFREQNIGPRMFGAVFMVAGVALIRLA